MTCDESKFDCCLHDLPEGAEHAPGMVCCHCGDIYLPLSDGPHGEYLPKHHGARAEKAEKARDENRGAMVDLLANLEELLAYTPHHWSCQKLRDLDDNCNCLRAKAETTVEKVRRML